jgi:hypothetical protein
VSVRFRRSSGEAPGTGATIDHYEVYRQLEPGPGYVLAGSVPASGASEYVVNVPTLVDASPASLEYSAFVVQAVTSGANDFYVSGVDNGFSLDNLPVTGVPSAPAIGLALEGALPNPAIGGRLAVGFALPSGEPAALELIDVTGRRVRSRSVGALGAGRHVLHLGDGLRPGLYFLRLSQGAHQIVARTTVMD